MKLDELQKRERAPVDGASGARVEGLAPEGPAASVPANAAAGLISNAPPTADLTFPDDETFRYVSGTAGTGKTFLMKSLAERDPRVMLTATTGIAAVNLGGTTINAQLRYFDTASLVELSTALDQRFIDWARVGKTHWVVDEASMLAGEQLRAFVLAVEGANAALEDYKTYNGPKVKLTLVGDFAQLPPVPDLDEATGKKKPVRYAFEMEEWDRFDRATTLLTEIKRQTDRDFIEALQAARRGDAAKALEYFRQFCTPNRELDFPGVTILAKNQQVDRQNEIKLSDLKAPRHSHPKHFWGKQRPEWTKHIPAELVLKEGATVMVLANRRREQDVNPGPSDYEYVNGDLGTVVDLETTAMQYRRGVPPEEVRAVGVHLFRTDETVDVAEVTRDFEELDEKGKKVVVGQVSYIPIRVAYATTVHKSQGLTLDRVQVAFGEHFFSSPGMLYVALSRCRGPKGLRLVGPPDLFLRRCGTSEKVRRWL